MVEVFDDVELVERGVVDGAVALPVMDVSTAC